MGRSKRLLIAGVVLTAVLWWCVSGLSTCDVCAQEGGNASETFEVPETEYIQGKVVEVIEEETVESEGRSQVYQRLKIRVTKGSIAGEEIEVENGAFPTAHVVTYRAGDKVMISYSEDFEGNPVFLVSDFVRADGILVLFVIFVVLALIVGARKGLFSLVSLGISFLVIFSFVLPQIQQGRDPVFIAILASVVMVPITFYLSHGFERKSTVAILGTFIALVVTGILSHVFVNLTHLSGITSEDAMLLQTTGTSTYNLKGLLLAGIIIGTLGVMDDITVSQAAIVYQLHDVKRDLSFFELFTRSIQVGKDHIASMVNTLVLVYTGASLPLLLIFMNNPRPFGDLLNLELISTEIVRTLVGSVGLILAVPITTYLACVFVKKKKGAFSLLRFG